MADPITLSIASISASALTEGIKFLYNQATELLKRWREKKDKEYISTESKEPIKMTLPDVFQNNIENSYIHYDVLKELDNSLLEIWQDLSVYANGIETVNPENIELLKKVDALRRVVETVIQQQITFKGEQRSSSSPEVISEMKAETVKGYLENLNIGKMKSGRVVSNTEIGKVEEGGKALGTRIDEMG